MRHRRERTNWTAVAVALLLATVLHLQLIFTSLLPMLYDLWRDLFPRTLDDGPVQVSFVPLPQAEWDALAQVARIELTPEPERPKPPEPERPEPEEPKPEPQERLTGQVVDVAPTPDSTPPEDARFLSEHNTRVERESISRDRRSDYNVAQPRPTVSEDRRRRPEQAPDQTQDSQQLVSLVTQKRGQRALEAPPAPRPSRVEIPDIQKREALKLKFDLALGELSAYEASEAMLGNSDKLRFQLGPSAPPIEPAPEVGEEGQHEQSVAMLQRPSLDKLDMIQGAPANDHVEDVVSGPETLLNSREFKYATFFNRVKRGVSQQWSPRVAEEYLRRDPYGNIYGIRDRHTVISVALDVDGKLSEISVQRSSGVQFFDDVAVQSFQQASPFHNPPRSLADPDGLIRFQFGFYFQIGERPIIRALRFDSRDF